MKVFLRIEKVYQIPSQRIICKRKPVPIITKSRPKNMKIEANYLLLGFHPPKRANKCHAAAAF